MVRVVVWLIGYVHKCTSFWTCLITFKQCSTINFPKIYVVGKICIEWGEKNNKMIKKVQKSKMPTLFYQTIQ